MTIYKRDKNGFLQNHQDWDRNFFNIIAKEETLDLANHLNEYLFICKILQEHYSSEQKSPAIRELLKILKASEFKNASSLYLQILFPNSPAVQAAKLSGLPKPKRCI